MATAPLCSQQEPSVLITKAVHDNAQVRWAVCAEGCV